MHRTLICELCDLLSKKEKDDTSLSSIFIKRKLINVENNVQLDLTFSSATFNFFYFDSQYQKI